MTAKFQQEKQTVENGAVDYLVSSGLDKRDFGLNESSLKVYLSESQEKRLRSTVRFLAYLCELC